MGRKKKEIIEDAPEIEVIEIEATEETPEVEEVVEETPEVEEVVEETPEVEKVAPQGIPEGLAPTPDHTYDAWWNEIGRRLNNRGYSKNGIIKRAKVAFGVDFNDSDYVAFVDAMESKTLINKVEAVWKSQK